jgi:hypothetical protein
MTPAERKQRQREREADQARRREPLETKRTRAQALAEQLQASARDVATKLADERKISISARDITRYLIGLDGTEHVRAALEGKPATSPPPQASESVTSNVTPPLNVTSNVTLSTPARDELACDFCGKKPGAVEFMVVWGDGDGVAMCSKCAAISEEAFDELKVAMMNRSEDLEERMRAFKRDVEQLAGELENHRRNGLVPEAEQALSVLAQQHLEAIIEGCVP